MSDRTELERQLAELPLYQYEFLKTDELTFTERVRDICRSECQMCIRDSWKRRSRTALRPASAATENGIHFFLALRRLLRYNSGIQFQRG